MITVDNGADFAPLGDIEFENAAMLFEYCELGRKAASNAGLILIQGAYDIYQALATIPPPMEGRSRSPQARARRVARHARRASEHLHAAQASLAKLPRAYLDEYQDIISARRPRNAFDPRKGL